jgi:hypothetical protein
MRDEPTKAMTIRLPAHLAVELDTVALVDEETVSPKSSGPRSPSTSPGAAPTQRSVRHSASTSPASRPCWTGRRPATEGGLMGQSTNAVMVYGYRFGSVESLEVAEAKSSDANPYGYFKTSWCDDENEDVAAEDGESMDLFNLMIRRLYESIPDAPAVEWGRQRADIVKERLGVWFEAHRSGEYPMYVLATAAFTAYRGDAKVVDVDRLRDDPAAGGWDAKLAEALRILEVTPAQERPSWLLVSYRG